MPKWMGWFDSCICSGMLSVSFMYCDTILFFDLANLCSNEARTIVPLSSGCRKSIGVF